jgi:hypothetical protein
MRMCAPRGYTCNMRSHSASVGVGGGWVGRVVALDRNCLSMIKMMYSFLLLMRMPY